jgi:hypothetical protein
MGPMKINLSQAFSGQKVGVKQVEEMIWLCRIESAADPFAAKVSPMSPV